MLTKSKPAAKPEAEPPKGERPPYRAWIVIDGVGGGKPIWTELTGLWPSQQREGLTGQIRRPLPNVSTTNRPRLVILPNNPADQED